MPHYRTSVRTDWSVDRAFDYLSDLTHFADWDPGVKRSVQVAGDGAAIGAVYEVTVGGIGRDLVLPYEIVVLDRPRRVEVRAETGTLRSVDVMSFEPTDAGGSVVTYDADLSLKGVLGVANPLLGLAFGRIGDRAAGGLRAALEATGT